MEIVLRHSLFLACKNSNDEYVQEKFNDALNRVAVYICVYSNGFVKNKIHIRNLRLSELRPP